MFLTRPKASACHGHLGTWAEVDGGFPLNMCQPDDRRGEEQTGRCVPATKRFLLEVTLHSAHISLAKASLATMPNFMGQRSKEEQVED